jgi:hypothetical protein
LWRADLARQSRGVRQQSRQAGRGPGSREWPRARPAKPSRQPHALGFLAAFGPPTDRFRARERRGLSAPGGRSPRSLCIPSVAVEEPHRTVRQEPSEVKPSPLVWGACACTGLDPLAGHGPMVRALETPRMLRVWAVGRVCCLYPASGRGSGSGLQGCLEALKPASVWFVTRMRLAGEPIQTPARLVGFGGLEPAALPTLPSGSGSSWLLSDWPAPIRRVAKYPKTSRPSPPRVARTRSADTKPDIRAAAGASAATNQRQRGKPSPIGSLRANRPVATTPIRARGEWHVPPSVGVSASRWAGNGGGGRARSHHRNRAAGHPLGTGPSHQETVLLWSLYRAQYSHKRLGMDTTGGRQCGNGHSR